MGIFNYFLHPAAELLKWLKPINGIHEKDRRNPLIEWSNNRPEMFLTNLSYMIKFYTVSHIWSFIVFLSFILVVLEKN